MAAGAKTGGRKKGTPNRATADVKAAAAMYTDRALRTLADIAMSGQSEAARVSAAVAILDRAHGKPAQAVQHGGDPDGVPIMTRLKVEFV